MALTRKALKAMGLTDEQVDSVIEMHTETVDGLKAERDTYKEKAGKYDEAQKELDGLKDVQAKYENEHKAFEDFKKAQTEKETEAAKETAVRKYFESKGITGSNLAIAMRGVKDEIKGIALDGETIKDSKALDDLVAGDFKGLIVKTSKKGADTSNPPANGGGAKTREDIYKKDDRGRYILDSVQRQKALAELMQSDNE